MWAGRVLSEHGDVTAAGGRQATLRVRTTGSQPQLVGGQLRYRLWMQVLSQESEATL